MPVHRRVTTSSAFCTSTAARARWLRDGAVATLLAVSYAALLLAVLLVHGGGRLDVSAAALPLLALMGLGALALAANAGVTSFRQAKSPDNAAHCWWHAMVLVAPDPICLIDVGQLRILSDNEFSRRLAAQAERAGENLQLLLVEGYAAAVQGPAEDMDRRTFDVHLPASSAGPARYLQANGVALQADDRPALLCVLCDVSLRVGQVHEQTRLRELAEADVRAKSHFVAAMGHEIRTPLHGILGHLELLARSRLEGEQRTRLRRVTQAADSLLETINDMLDLASVEAGQLSVAETVFSPMAMLERVALLYAPLAQGKGLDLDVSSALPAAFQVRAAQARIEQVLRNLVSNAIKFTASGRVEIRLLWASHSRLRFEIADSGIGLGIQQRDRLFEPFVQADASIGDRYGGTGLGLSLSRQLCRLMGGDIDVESTEGVGSVFSFEVVAAAAPHRQELPCLPGRTVIVLSAVAIWREQLARVLRESGAEVLAAADPADLAFSGLRDGTPLVVFERNLAGTTLPAEFAGEIVRVRADGPLRARREGGQWWVSCYAMEALLSVLVQVTAETR